MLFIPILLGWIPFKEINWHYLGTSFLLHIILIIIFELALLYLIVPINNPIELYKLVDNISEDFQDKLTDILSNTKTHITQSIWSFMSNNK